MLMANLITPVARAADLAFSHTPIDGNGAGT
jgi:hypothetical protein